VKVLIECGKPTFKEKAGGKEGKTRSRIAESTSQQKTRSEVLKSGITIVAIMISFTFLNLKTIFFKERIPSGAVRVNPIVWVNRK